jgi:hypothetical protein
MGRQIIIIIIILSQIQNNAPEPRVPPLCSLSLSLSLSLCSDGTLSENFRCSGFFLTDLRQMVPTVEQ